MILATDVYYYEQKAKAVSIEFLNWEEESIQKINAIEIEEVEDYVSGAFYKRELPALLGVINLTERSAIDLIIVDSYVILDDDGKHGMGAYLYEALDRQIPVIGVAKKKFLSNTKNSKAILRGSSKTPLYVSSIGIDLVEAAQRIQSMQGDFRMPDLLKRVDQESRK